MTKRTAPARKFPGDYRIIDEVASSATSRIFLGETISSPHQLVVIKHFYTTHLDTQQEEDFRREMRFLQQLHHPSILSLITAGIDKGIPYIVMDYAPNSSLDKSMHHQAHLPWPQKRALTIILQIGQALQYAHQHNIIHGNLKPQNILFDTHEQALLGDFHLVSLPESLQASAPTTYMAPEQLLGASNKACDQYALGCIAYEMLTGHTPYHASSLYYPGNRRHQPTLVAPTLLNPLLDSDIELAILKALAPEPDQRHRDIQTFLSILRSSANDDPGEDAANTSGLKARPTTIRYARATPQPAANRAAFAHSSKGAKKRTNDQSKSLSRSKTPIFKQKKIIIAFTCILLFVCIISGLYVIVITQSKPHIEPTPTPIKAQQFIITSSHPIAPTPTISNQLTDIQTSLSTSAITQPSVTDASVPSTTTTPIVGTAPPSLVSKNRNVDRQFPDQRHQPSSRWR
jgi:serine/threonine protein kinase